MHKLLLFVLIHTQMLDFAVLFLPEVLDELDPALPLPFIFKVDFAQSLKSQFMRYKILVGQRQLVQGLIWQQLGLVRQEKPFDPI